MEVSWQDLWVPFHAHISQVHGPVKFMALLIFRWVCPLRIRISRENCRKSPSFGKCLSCPGKNFPTGKPSYLPLVSPHICIQITTDIRSQRLAVCHHSVGLSTKNEQELRLDLESMVKIIDPSSLLIPDQQSKILPPSNFQYQASPFVCYRCLLLIVYLNYAGWSGQLAAWCWAWYFNWIFKMQGAWHAVMHPH